MSALTLSTALFSLLTAAAVLWLNPRRFSNQTFCAASLVLAGWLFCVYQVMCVAVEPSSPNLDQVERWLRYTGFVAALMPAAVWLQIESTLVGDELRHSVYKQLKYWLGLGALLLFLATQPSFAAFDPTLVRLVRGNAYVVYNLIAILAFVGCLITTYRRLPSLDGLRRLELKFLSLSMGYAVLVLGISNTIGSLFDIRIFNRLSIVAILVGYLFTAAALIFNRSLAARERMAGFLHKMLLVVLASICALLVSGFQLLPDSPVARGLVFATCFSGLLYLHHSTRRWFEFDHDALLDQARREVIQLASKEQEPESLRPKLEKFLQSHFKTAWSALVDSGQPQDACAIAELHPAGTLLPNIGAQAWLTADGHGPATKSSQVSLLCEILKRNRLEVLASAPKGSPNPTIAIALGQKPDQSAFSPTEIARLQNLAELMDNVLTKARVVCQAALEARLQHMGIMSRGLSHDLKNLMTPLTELLSKSSRRANPGSTESFVHRSAETAVEVMGSYLHDSLFFSGGAGRPQCRIDFVELTKRVRDIAAYRAKQENLTVRCISRSHEASYGDPLLLERMLLNLLGNAMDASRSGQSIQLSVASHGFGWLRLSVIDEGCGIAPENLERVFEPYFTTKEQPNSARGFGLGLTIAQKVAALHGGRIQITSAPGQGTCATVELPVRRAPAPLQDA